MVKSIRSTDRIAARKGRCLPACFLLTLSAAASATDLALNLEHQSSHGLMTTGQWQGEALEQSAPHVISAYRASVSASHDMADLTWFAAHSAKAYFSGRSNVLALAASVEDAGEFQLPASGRYKLDGKFSALRSTDIGIVKNLDWSDQISFRLRPYVSFIEHYERIEGTGAIDAQAGDATVKGRVSRVGTRDYGYLTQDRPDSGWGLGLDLGLSLRQGPWFLQVDAENLLSRLQFSSVHYSQRQYDVLARDGQLLIKGMGEFSMAGQYGIGQRQERLPVHTFWTLTNSEQRGWRGGLFTLDERVSPWLGYRLESGHVAYEVQTMACNNLTLGALWSPSPALQLGAGMTLVQQKTPALGQLTLRYRF